jgi:glucose/arabinose dehydrogenase
LNRLIKLLYILFASFLIAACGSSSTLVSQTTTPVSSQNTTVSPTETPVQIESSLVIPTSTTSTLPVATPTVNPGIEAQRPQQFPDPFEFGWKLVHSGLSSPIGLVNAGDGSDRLFVVEQAGMVKVIKDLALLETPFLDISQKISCCGERGLLGLAFHPQYSENGYFFANYTDLNGDTVIARFEVSEDLDQADPASETRLLSVEQPYANHNGGGIAFGPDGYLYVALGDGGSGGDPLGNAQNTNSLLGKLLRIDVSAAEGYAIPADNPFTDGGGAPEVWAFGLRNPWRFSFDRLTGDIFIGDVGQGSWEEIDFLPAGSAGGVNFGWNYLEGSQAFATAPEPGDLELIDPVAEYGRDQGYSVIGGVVYRGGELPVLKGIYFYGDYGTGNIWGLYLDNNGAWQNKLLFQTGRSITSFGEDEKGELYYVAMDGGLYQLVSE